MGIVITLLNDDLAMLAVDGEMLPRGTRKFSVSESAFTLLCVNLRSRSRFIAFSGKGLFTHAEGVDVFEGGEGYYVRVRFFALEQKEVLREGKIEGGKHRYMVFRGEDEGVLIESDSAFIKIAESNTGRLCEITPIGERLVVRFSEKLFVLNYDGDYVAAFESCYDSYTKRGGTLYLTRNIASMEGYFEKTTVSLLPAYNVSVKRGKSRVGNFCEKTRMLAFYESLLYGTDGDVMEFLTSDYSAADVKRLKKYVGAFCEIIKADDVYLAYKTEGNYILRRFGGEQKQDKICDIYER